MKFEEYGNPEGASVLILHHTKDKSWTKQMPEQELLYKQYRIIVPILNGDCEIKEIRQYIREKCDGQLCVACAYDDGWYVMSCLMGDETIHIQKIIVETSGSRPGKLVFSSLIEEARNKSIKGAAMELTH